MSKNKETKNWTQVIGQIFEDKNADTPNLSMSEGKISRIKSCANALVEFAQTMEVASTMTREHLITEDIAERILETQKHRMKEGMRDLSAYLGEVDGIKEEEK